MNSLDHARNEIGTALALLNLAQQNLANATSTLGPNAATDRQVLDDGLEAMRRAAWALRERITAPWWKVFDPIMGTTQYVNAPSMNLAAERFCVEHLLPDGAEVRLVITVAPVSQVAATLVDPDRPALLF
jgi:hypothetical protein